MNIKKRALSSIIFFIFLFFISSARIQSENRFGKTQLTHLYYSLKNSAEEYLKKGRFQEAVQAFQQALMLAEEVKHHEKIECYMRLGLLYWNTGKLNKSSSNYTKALSLAERFDQKDKVEECRKALDIYKLYMEGKRCRYSANYQKSIECLQEAINLARQLGSKEHEVKCLRQLSVTYWKMNNLRQFIYLNNKALRIAQELNHNKEKGRCLNNIGLFYWRLNFYSDALNYFQEALTIAKKEINKANEAELLNNIGIIYKDLGQYEKAIDSLEKALVIDKKLGDDVYISMDLSNIGETYRNRGIINDNKKDFYKALNYFNQCFKLTKKTDDKRTQLRVLNNIGTVYSDLENYKQALQHFQLGYKNAEGIQDKEAMGMLLNNMGIVNFNQDNNKKAKFFLHKAIVLSSEFQSSQILWEAYFWLARCNEKTDHYFRAVTYYKKALEVIEGIRSQISLDSYKTGFARDKIKVYEFLVNLLYKMHTEKPHPNNFGKEIFYIVERAKARAFLESLKESKIDIQKRLSPKLRKKERDIAGDISSILISLSKENLSSDKRNELAENLKKKEEEYFHFISKIKVEIPEIASLVSPEPCGEEEIRKILLDKKTAIIEYFLGEKRSLMFVLTKNNFSFHVLPSRESIVKSIRAYVKILSQPPKEEFKGFLASRRIYKELLSFAERNIGDSVENLIIIPDGILYYLPFETLIIPGSENSIKENFLINKYKISYAPSSSSLLFLLKKKIHKEPSKGLLAFGDPFYSAADSSRRENNKTYAEVLKELYSTQGFDCSALPYSQKEIQLISRYFLKGKKDIYLQKEAKEDLVKRIHLKDYKIIHFACHGFLDEKFPHRSALVLALDDDKSEDGFLQVREIYNLRINADLIVLSACQTGRGRLEKVEGILGLPRIFFYAGADSVVSTLWKVRDKATAIFMNHFYHYLSQGHDKSQSLRLAKLKMMNSKFSHPFYWSAFILNGDYSAKLNFN